MDKKIDTGFDSSLLTIKLRTAVDEEGQTIMFIGKNLNGHDSSLILNSSILPININTPNPSGIMNKSLLSQTKLKVKAQVTHQKSYVKCEISSINNKIELLFERLNNMSSTEKKVLEILQEKFFHIEKINE